MVQHDLIDDYPALPELQLFQSSMPLEIEYPRAWFLGPTWMDGTAICVSSSCADAVIRKATHVAGKLLELCTEHGMSPNLKRGKTEVLLSLRGPNSRKLKIDCVGPDASRAFPVVTEPMTYDISLQDQQLPTSWRPSPSWPRPTQRGEASLGSGACGIQPTSTRSLPQ